MPSNGAVVWILHKDESFLKILFAKGSPSVTRSSRVRHENRRGLTMKKAKVTRCLLLC